ncbi:MAG: hypothetical protein R3298_01405 [Gammaproteobacteria bacterium]|nr:hypothetical protein [Gammaproteobacteria bacterium]
MRRRRHRPLTWLSLAALLSACAATVDEDTPSSYPFTFSDRRATPLEVAKLAEGDGVRYVVGESFLGPALIDVLHRELLIRAPRLPRPVHIEVTGLDVSILVADRGVRVGPDRVLLASGPYRPAPGVLVLEAIGSGRATVRVRIDFRLDDEPRRVESNGEVVTDDVRQRVGEIYRESIERLAVQLRQTG